MGFVSILVALLLEQARPLSRGNIVHLLSRMWVRAVGRSLDTGRDHHAALAWTVGVLVPGLLAAVVYWAVLSAFGWPFAVLWIIAVLYVTLGFRQFSFHFTEIRNALDAGRVRTGASTAGGLAACRSGVLAARRGGAAGR